MLKYLLISMFLVTSIFASVDDDASADHNILSPTAQTIREGEMTFNSYELVLAGLSYGISDQLQLTGSFLLPLVSGTPLTGMITAKYQLSSDESSALAIQPGIMFMTKDGYTIGAFTLTGIFDLYLNNETAITFSGILYKGFASGKTDSAILEGFVLNLTGAINYKLSDFIKFVAEVTLPGGYIDGELTLASNGMLFNYGIKFFNRDLSALISFIKPIGGSGDFMLLGWPYVTFTAKF